MIRFLTFLTVLVSLASAGALHAENYVIDSDGAHASIQFRIKHLGYSWLYGRFNRFEGAFSYDESAPEAAKVSVTIDTRSLDSNHEKRDKHLRSDEFLDVEKYPKAEFVSTGVTVTGEGTAIVHGKLTLHGVTRDLDIAVNHIGAGPDPWGGIRRGFEGSTRFALADFDINFNLGPASKEVELILNVEGVQQQESTP